MLGIWVIDITNTTGKGSCANVKGCCCCWTHLMPRTTVGTHQKSILQNEWMNVGSDYEWKITPRPWKQCKMHYELKTRILTTRKFWRQHNSLLHPFPSSLTVWAEERSTFYFGNVVCANESSYFPNAHSARQTNLHVLATFCIVQTWMSCFLPPNDEQDHLLHPPPIIVRQPNLSESDLLRMIVTCTETKDDGEDRPMRRLAGNDYPRSADAGRPISPVDRAVAQVLVIVNGRMTVTWHKRTG